MDDTTYPSIEVIFDCPSKNEDLKMPVLDLNLETREHVVRIMHKHYTKEVASKVVVNARSALPWKAKRTIRTQEIV